MKTSTNQRVDGEELIRVSQFKTSSFALCEFWHFKHINQMKFHCPAPFIFVVLCHFSHVFRLHIWRKLRSWPHWFLLFLFSLDSSLCVCVLHMLVLVFSLLTLLDVELFLFAFMNFSFTNILKWGWIIANCLVLRKRWYWGDYWRGESEFVPWSLHYW